jgi:SAM-dependent methyltransferase
MDKQRNLLTGVGNIIRFNWGFYAAGIGIITILLVIASFTELPVKWWMNMLAMAGFIPLFLSLAASWYVYDLSGFYTLNWLKYPVDHKPGIILNIHAGFDETSVLLKEKFPDAVMKVYDFYDPEKHTEISIEWARKAYPPYLGSIGINTDFIPEPDNSVDAIFLIFAAHEIRDKEERTRFFKEIKRVLKPTGTVKVVEHLRNLPNFLAYTVGFLHFHSAATWQQTFAESGLSLHQSYSINPFVKYYILQK